MKRYMKRLKKTSVNYIRAEAPATLPSTRTGGTRNYNIPTSGTAVKIPWSGYWWPLADRDIYGTDIINLYDNNRAMDCNEVSNELYNLHESVTNHNNRMN